jgi:hypothetical protein
MANPVRSEFPLGFDRADDAYLRVAIPPAGSSSTNLLARFDAAIPVQVALADEPLDGEPAPS